MTEKNNKIVIEDTEDKEEMIESHKKKKNKKEREKEKKREEEEDKDEKQTKPSKKEEEKIESELENSTKVKKNIVEFCELCFYPKELCEITHKLLLKRKDMIYMGEKIEEVKNDVKSNTTTPNKEDESKPITTNENKSTEIKNPTTSQEAISNKEAKSADNNEVSETPKDGEKEKDNVVEEVNKKKKKIENKILIKEIKRGKRKHTTHVYNLEKFGINMKDVAKAFSKKFACSATVIKEEDGAECISITGDFMFESQELLLEKFDVLKEEDFKIVPAK